ncbi:Down syndrome cell adhesion molecule-like protein Dscam2 isoform X6 [Ceratina calcarata]|uniref:Down syndrome cell adhesion molecule-like protein Dscam2 isoform X6 n=1 Tax=Ceratina calcarata TaxID=156304 RepID=A0AAJ7W970_9HYME|nr:Down syndrome cell adhesion molecule-like protein Dscam2 isoform X6 [Ceratina calcarata]
MTGTREDKTRCWIRMTCLFADSARHVVTGFLPFWILFLLRGCDASYEMQGPSFVSEPASRVEFTNVNGGRVDCIVRGNPAPTVDWLAADGGSITSIPGIRHVLGNGTIHFPGFEAEVFRQDVHWAIYKCSAVNSVGAIVSRDVTVRAVVNQRYDPEVQCPGGFLGNNVLMRCNVPSFVRDHVTITSWLQEPSFNIYPSTMADGKYHMLSTGELMILNITREDAERTYRCRTHHRLTQETVVSSNVGRLQLTEIRSTMPPMINEKVVYMSSRLKDTVVIPCVAYGNPTPANRWYYTRNQREEPIEDSSGRYLVKDGSLIIQGVQESDAGSYTCTASNSEGSESMEVRLTVSAPLSVHVQPSIQTVDLGKAAHLTCSASGFPQAALYWLKDGQPLRTGARIRAVSRERISVMSVAREDRGMYQCFVRNEYEMAQGIAELRLGEIAPQLVYRFIEQTMQTGPSVSLKCSAAGNPTPQISWLLDGFPLPQNDRLLIGQYVTVYGDVISHVNISSVKSEDGGEYECIASSRAGEARHSARLNIYGLPYVRPMSTVSAVAGKQFRIKCPVAGHPIESIIWEKDGVKLPTNMRQKVANGSLYIDMVQRAADQGTYTCTARNKHNFTSQRSVEVRVLVPPRWTVEPIDQNAVVGHGVSIACQAEGFPIPTVTWRQSIGDTPGDYRELGYSGTEGAGVAGNGSLAIPRVTRDHAGFYLCQASNGIGPGLSKLIQLTVHAGPQVSVKTRQESVRRGESVTLRCEAEGDAPLDLSWRARDSRVDPNYDVRYTIDNQKVSGRVISELRIIQANHIDRGDYMCVATNAYGHARATINLLVQEPPNFPRDLHIAEQGSRSLLLAWSSPSSEQDPAHANSPITNYIVQYKEAQDVWHEHNTQKMVSGDNTVALISPLKPATSYHFRVLAENHLGTSAPSDILHTQTEGEIPSGPPRHVTVEALGPQQVKVTWQPPDRSLWNGELLGYTISYANLGGNDQSVNITRVGITGNGDGSYDYKLTGLRKYTQYSIVVKAFNNKGDGPGSDPVTVQTLEDVPSAPPQTVACAALTGQTIQVTWKPPPSDKVHGVVQGYKLLYEAASAVLEQQAGRETKIVHALSTVLHGLSPYTNYTVQVLAYTRAGEGVTSSPVSCTTEETVPDAPERVKAVTSNEDAVVISWLPPRRPNGILTKYTVHIRVLDQGQEVKITKSSLPAQSLHHEATGLKLRESYEAWVTASTKVGQGPRTPVIKLQLSSTGSTIPAAIISFGVPLVVPWRVDVNMACLAVGNPPPTLEWRRGDVKLQQRSDIGPDNTLTLRNVQRSHEGNYSCHVKNSLGSDEIAYTLQVQVPPTPPTLLATGTTTDAVQLQWKQGDNGGAAIRGFLLAYRREFSEWEEVMLDRKATTHLLEGLQCGTKYQFTLAAFNRIGSGSASKIETVKTNGTKPVAPKKHQLIKVNQTFVTLELNSWQDGGCPLLYFVVEYRRLPGDWLLVSNNVPPQSRFPIVDLEPGTKYELRVSAYNNAGSTQAEYLFSTLPQTGSNRIHDEHSPEIEETSLFFDAHVLAPSVISLLAVFLAVAGVCFCLKTHAERSGRANDPNSQTQAALENKHNMEQREQYYATVRKPGQQSPCREVSALERIPEYSEDIYPYATFNLPEQENLSANPMRQAFYYERSETMLQGNQCDMDQYTKVRGRARRKSKSFKSESEEYDTLGSDSDTEVGTSSRTESSNHLDDSGPASIMTRSPGPNSIGQREQRLALVPRPVHHNVLYHTHESSTSTEPSPTSERKTFPRLEKQRNQGATADIGMDGRVPGILRPVLKLSESGMHSYSRGALSNHPSRPGSCDRLGKDPSSRKSVESLCLLEEPGSSRMPRREEDWGSELSTLELKPPTGFTDAHETSEAECDIDMKLKLHRKRTGFPSNSLSKSPKDFTITV